MLELAQSSCGWAAAGRLGRRHLAPEPLERDGHFDIAARRGGVHGGGNLFNVQLDKRPLRSAQHHEGDSAARKILLIAHIVVGCQKHVETGPPASVSNSPLDSLSHPRSLAFVITCPSGKKLMGPSAVIKQDEHRVQGPFQRKPGQQRCETNYRTINPSAIAAFLRSSSRVANGKASRLAKSR
jgi:hypothetical protein